VIRLPNDHTAAPRPADGYSYRASFVADNDLALGRIVAFLTKTAIWKDSALFVTEDDAQGGVDHMDAHRSILLVASPWVKPGAVSHQHTSMGSITRTIDELLGLEPDESGGCAGRRDHRHLLGAAASGTVCAAAGGSQSLRACQGALRQAEDEGRAAALRDMDDADQIRKEVEKSAASFISIKTTIDFLVL